MVVKTLPTNLLVERFLAAQEVWGLFEISPRLAKASDFNMDAPQTAGQSADEWQQAPDGIRQWAARVWAIQWGEGTFWDWINEGGARAITAAKILFGDQALSKLIERTHSAPHITPGEPNE